jgi:biopolymer transport protein ExbB/TolQ
MAVFDFLAIGIFVGLPALEFYAWFTASWWHSDRQLEDRGDGPNPL